jgi:hypothetical protein
MAGPFIKGRNARLLLTVNGANVTLAVKNFRATEVATEGEDSPCGEDRDHPFIVTNYFRITFAAYQRDQSIITAWFAMLAADDAQVAPLKAVCGVTYNYRDGTKQSYMATQCTRSPLDVDTDARASSVMFNSGFRARYYKPTQ